MFTNKVLLITGGTGSFGNAVARRFLDSDLREIRIFSRDEKKQDDMRKRYNHPKLKFYIGDVRELRSVAAAMRGVDYVFHAAALKQVPSCEFHPMEAVRTNVLGTENVLEAPLLHGVKRVVCLSTDKAVYPINAMGISKAMMEKVMVAASRNLEGTATTICGTRYGNVMASRGSVIPLFVEQVRQASPSPSPTRHDPLHDDAGRCGGTGAVCLQARQQWRHFCAKGPRRHGGGAHPSHSGADGQAQPPEVRNIMAPAMAKSCLKPCWAAKKWPAPKTWATISACPLMAAT
jgi:NADP-dependent 3-hydroxy acid dehydrogenase YdfG